MFHVYQSNKVETLLAQLVRVLMEMETSPLQSQTVVVENPGLAHWLKMQLANSLGISANIEFPMPSRFFWQLQRKIQAHHGKELEQESVFSKDTLSWLVFECLNDASIINRKSFSLLKDYIEANGDESSSIKQGRCFQLASTIADLYDQYLVYRPDWIESWQNNEFIYDEQPLAEHQWQGELWQLLIERAQQKGLSTHHRAGQLQDFLDLLSSSDAHTLKEQLPSSVVFFGFSTLPKHQIETLNILSQHMDVQVLTPNPCMHYWGDAVDETTQARLRQAGKELDMVDAGNDLLASLGTLGKDYQRLLLEVENIQEHDLFSESTDENLLSFIQNQILDFSQPKNTSSQPFVLNKQDNSVQLVGCHSPMREIEVLHNQLLHVFESTDTQPQDVVVMIPDVASYAPYIDAVFNSAKQYVPYSISDRPIQAEHPLINGFQLLINLPKGRLTLPEVWQLLDIPAVHQAYGLAAKQLPKLKDWVNQAAIRWGFDEDHRVKQGLPAWQQNTWLYGFKRMLMGYAVSDAYSGGHGYESGQRNALSETSPLTSIEGLEAQSLGPLIDFVSDLHEFNEASLENRSPNEWSHFISETLQRFFAPEDDEQYLLEHIYQALENWLSASQQVFYDEPVAYDILLEGINKRLQSTSGSQHFMVGKVNFCTLLPMRSIPFKMVAVLGLNDSDYPRSVTPNSLDLMRFKHRLGDRSRRNEDRYLFLEAILSARESLWLSYKSRDQKNDEPLTPSVVLAEFMDFIEDNVVLASNAIEADSTLEYLFTQHPLQAFNPAYFTDNNNKLFSYNSDWLSVHEINHAHEINKNEGSNAGLASQAIEFSQEVFLEDFIQFYQHPAKYYLNTVLNVSLNIWAHLQEDDEPFDLDGLTQFQLKQQLLEAKKLSLVQGQTNNAHGEDFKRISEGQLAYGNIGTQQSNRIQQAMAPVLNSFELAVADQSPAMAEVNLNFGSARLIGWLRNVYDHQLVNVITNKLSGKWVIKHLIEHACLNAMGSHQQSTLICQDHKLTFKPMAAKEAKDYLQSLFELYKQGIQQPLLLLPQTAWQSIRPKKLGGRSFNHELHSSDAFFGKGSGAFAVSGERDDLHVQRCFEDQDLESIPPSNSKYAEIMYGPWLELIEIEELGDDA